MTKKHDTASEPQLAAVAEGIINDIQKLVGEHIDLLREEVKGEVRQAATAAASLGTGAGLTALGGVLGTLMVVHLLHRTTRLPLWACYGLVGGTVGGLGAGLLYSGGREAAGLRLLPRQTVRAVREDFDWVKEQALPARD
jgi:hypothetical protein